MSTSPRLQLRHRLAQLVKVVFVFGLFGIRPAPAAEALDLLEPSEDLLSRGVQVRQHLVHGVEVLEVVLGRVDFDAQLPIVMRIHGRMSDWHLPTGSYAALSEPYRLLIPRGTLKTGERRSWAAPSVLSKRPGQLESEVGAAADRLADVLAYFRAHRRLVGEPIVTGFSQGGMVALAMGVRHPGAVGTVLPMAAHLVVPLPSGGRGGARFPEIHALHGAADSIVAPGPAEEARDRLRAAGFVSTLEILPAVGHETTGAMAEAHRELLKKALDRAASQRFGFGA